VLPGLVDAHSHAFQRAFAGRAETRAARDDDFWSWRDRMYAVALRIEPPALKAIAAQLYAELLAGGYTHVCEFHYLHRAPDGRRYDDALLTSRALVAAATQAGIGLTLLPVLYERAGFHAPALRDDQRRFAMSVDDVLACRDGVRALRAPNVDASVAVHSLRAATPASIRTLSDRVAGDRGAIHIHVAEQQREVDDCLRSTGERPIAWLAAHVDLDARWQLVHATHATPDEIDAVARSGAGVVVCPTTEANLGDGVPDLGRWLDADVPLSLGSDSNVARDWPDELRTLEYGQRLALQRRNVAARPERGSPSTAATLFARTLDGGRRAAGLSAWGLVEGARADLVVLDDDDAVLANVPGDEVLDALVFTAGARAIRHVMVGGRWVVRDRVHASGADIATAFREAMRPWR
jgi:formimidoylglutamate deiminase